MYFNLCFFFHENAKKDTVNNDRGSYSSCYTKREYPTEHNLGGQFDVYDDSTDKITLTVSLNQGSISFAIYDWNSKDIEKKYDSMLSKTDINESGVYEYNLDYLPAGSYWVDIRQNDSQTEGIVEYLDEHFQND